MILDADLSNLADYMKVTDVLEAFKSMEGSELKEMVYLFLKRTTKRHCFQLSLTQKKALQKHTDVLKVANGLPRVDYSDVASACEALKAIQQVNDASLNVCERIVWKTWLGTFASLYEHDAAAIEHAALMVVGRTFFQKLQQVLQLNDDEMFEDDVFHACRYFQNFIGFARSYNVGKTSAFEPCVLENFPALPDNSSAAVYKKRWMEIKALHLPATTMDFNFQPTQPQAYKADEEIVYLQTLLRQNKATYI